MTAIVMPRGRRRGYQLALVSLLPLAASGGVIASDPPKPVSKAQLAGSALLGSAVLGFALGGYHVSFGSSKLSELGMRFSNNLIEHSQSDTGGGMSWLCFTILGDRYRQRIWVVSDDEFGGTEKLVTGVYVVPIGKNVGETTVCPKLSLKRASLDNGVWLNSSQRQLAVATDAPEVAAKGWWRYSYMGTASLAVRGSNRHFDVSSWIDVRMVHGRADAVMATTIFSD